MQTFDPQKLDEARGIIDQICAESCSDVQQTIMFGIFEMHTKQLSQSEKEAIISNACLRVSLAPKTGNTVFLAKVKGLFDTAVRPNLRRYRCVTQRTPHFI